MGLKATALLLIVGGMVGVLIFLATPREIGSPAAPGVDFFMTGPNGQSPRTFNAFLPSPQEKTARGGGAAIPQNMSSSSLSELLRINDLVFPKTAIVPKAGEILALPEIAPDELTIDPNGVATLSHYLEYFADRSRDGINFSYEKLKAVLTNESGIPLLLPDLIERALGNNSLSEIHASLLTIKEFLSSKIDFMKSIKVTAEAEKINSAMISLDKLGLDLIGKALEAEAGKITKADLQNFYAKYKNTVLFYNQDFRKKVSGLFSPRKEGFGWRIIEDLGLARIARALGLPFGGLITVEIPCLCSGGLSITVGPPRPAKIFISFAQLSSPLLFAYKAIHPGAWILGEYSGGSPPCLEPAVPTCVPVDFPIGIFLFAGTSL